MTDAPIYDSSRRPSPIVEELVQAVRYRDLVSQLVRRDIVARYKRSALGVAWTMLHPLGMMLVLSIAFSQVFGAQKSYAAYLLVGIVTWTFFSQTTVFAMRQLIWGGVLIHRIYVPKTIFAIAAVGTGLVNYLLSLIPLAIVLLVDGVAVRRTVVFLPVSLCLLAAFSLGVGLLLSTVAAYFPDVAEMYEIVLQAWMYLTPIIYPEEIIPTANRWWLFDLNPMYHLLKLFRLSLFEGQWPGLEQVSIAALIALGTLVVGWFVFTRKADEFAYRI